jgi:hypothetical protein
MARERRSLSSLDKFTLPARKTLLVQLMVSKHPYLSFFVRNRVHDFGLRIKEHGGKVTIEFYRFQKQSPAESTIDGCSGLFQNTSCLRVCLTRTYDAQISVFIT